MPADFIETQLGFTAYLRNPEQAPCPTDVPARRMQAYRELLTNNVESAISACFPVLRGIIGETRWLALVHEFFASHRAHSPIYREIPAEFRAWLAATPLTDLKSKFPFLLELTHYEWMELALDIDPAEIPVDGIDPQGDMLAGRPVLNPLARLLNYHYPVHRVGPDVVPTEPPAQPTRLVMVRNRQHEISFLEVNPLVARLIETLAESSAASSGADLLQQLHAEFPAIPPETFMQGGTLALQELADRDIILGTLEHTRP